MIEYKNNMGDGSVQFSGDVSEAVVDIMLLTNMLYNDFYDFNPESAKVFQYLLLNAFAYCDVVFLRQKQGDNRMIVSICMPQNPNE